MMGCVRESRSRSRSRSRKIDRYKQRLVKTQSKPFSHKQYTLHHIYKEKKKEKSHYPLKQKPTHFFLNQSLLNENFDKKNKFMNSQLNNNIIKKILISFHLNNNNKSLSHIFFSLFS
jgi:hypothetical protein